MGGGRLRGLRITELGGGGECLLPLHLLSLKGLQRLLKLLLLRIPRLVYRVRLRLIRSHFSLYGSQLLVLRVEGVED